MGDFKELSSLLMKKYEFLDYGHAMKILTTTYQQEWMDLVDCLEAFEITKSDIVNCWRKQKFYSQEI